MGKHAQEFIMDQEHQETKSEFEQLDNAEMGFFEEFWDFLKHNKKWWLLPMILVLMGLGLLVMLSGGGAAPFIYTLF